MSRLDDLPEFKKYVLKVFPKATDHEIDHYLWNHTPFPYFWDSNDPEIDILKSLRILKATLEKDREPCYFCNRPAKQCQDLCPACLSEYDDTDKDKDRASGPVKKKCRPNRVSPLVKK